MKHLLLICLFSCTCALGVFSQNLTQTVRGTVVDKISQSPVPGAVVQVQNMAPPLVATTDAEGRFRFSQVPVGKQSLRITYMGYKEALMDNLSVNAG